MEAPVFLENQRLKGIKCSQLLIFNRTMGLTLLIYVHPNVIKDYKGQPWPMRQKFVLVKNNMVTKFMNNTT